MMVVLLTVVFVILQVLRFCFAGTRRHDRLFAAALCGVAGSLAMHPGVVAAIDEAAGIPGAAMIARLNFFFICLWLVRGAFAEAVHGIDHRRWSTGITLTVVCGGTWMILLWGVYDPRYISARDMMLEHGFKPSLQYILCLAYITAVILEIANYAFKIFTAARTRAVQVSGITVCAGAAVIGVTSLARACLYTTVIVDVLAGRRISDTAVETEQVLVAVSMGAGTVAVIGTALPTVPVGGRWIADYFRACSVLMRMRPLWKRAVCARGGYLSGIRSVNYADPVARLHRRTVEIRDAQLAGDVRLTPPERALVSSTEAWLSRPQGDTQ